MKNWLYRLIAVSISMLMAMLMIGCGSGGQTSNNPSDNSTPTKIFVNLSQIKSYDEGTAAPGTTFRYNMTGTVCWHSSCDNLVGTDSIIVSQPITTDNITYNITRDDTSITNTVSNVTTSGTATNYILQTGNMYKVVYDDGDIGTVTSQNLLPTNPAVGDIGNYITLSYSDGSTETGTWQIEQTYNGDGLIKFTFIRIDKFSRVMWRQEIGHVIKSDGYVYDITIKTTYDDGTIVELQGNRI